MGKKINIYGTLSSQAEDKVVAETGQLWDKKANKTQEQLNQQFINSHGVSAVVLESTLYLQST